MDSNLNVANITLKSSTDFVLQPANAAKVASDLPFSQILRFATSRCTIHYLLLDPYFKVICKLIRE